MVILSFFYFSHANQCLVTDSDIIGFYFSSCEPSLDKPMNTADNMVNT